MAYNALLLGTVANDGTGDTPRAAGTKLNTMLAELYAASAVCVDAYGAIGDGTTDDTDAINDALSANKVVCLNPSKRYLVDSADLVIPAHTVLLGPHRNLGEEASRVYTGVGGCLLLNTSYTVRLYGAGAAVFGVGIYRKGMTKPANVRQALDLVAAFAGTAITVGDGSSQAASNVASDTYVGHCFIAGFEYAYYNYWNERPRVEYISGDCTNGIYMRFITDMCHVNKCHFWPFLITHESYTFTSFSVTAAANNGGGLVRLTIGSHTLQIGDAIAVQSVLGTTEANGTWTVAGVGATTIDLTGSTYANAYVSGGTVHAIGVWKRSGIAYKFYDTVDWGQATDSFAYGYATSFDIESSDQCTLMNCGADYYANAADYDCTGFYVRGTSKATALIGCKSASVGKKYRINTSAAYQNSTSMAGCRSWGSWGGLGYHLYHEGGFLNVTGHLGQTGGSIYVDDSVSGLKISTSELTGITMVYEGATARSKVLMDASGQTPFSYDTTYRRFSDANAPTQEFYAASASGEGWQRSINRARGTTYVPTVVSSGDNVYDDIFSLHDGTSYTNGFLLRYEADAAPSSGKAPIRVREFFQDQSSGSLVQARELDSKGNFSVGVASLGTTATDGFLYIPSCAGIPTGTPTTKTGRAPLVIDSTNNKLYAYIGGAWRIMN